MTNILPTTRRHLVLTCAVVMISLWVGFATSAHAQDEQDSVFNLTTITCWDLSGTEVDERVPAMMMLYGYVVGSHNLSVQDGKDIGPALERVGKLCSANPDMYVVSAMERVVLQPTP